MFSPLQAAVPLVSCFDSESAGLVLQLLAHTEWDTSLMRSLASSLMRVSTHFEQFIFNWSQIESILSCQILHTFGPQTTERGDDSLELCVITESGMMEDVAVIGLWLIVVITVMLRYPGAAPLLLTPSGARDAQWTWHNRAIYHVCMCIMARNTFLII